ncbi:MAG TPA: Gfo/Idh/MocA family oxidoreductase [Candidatus Omnitrophota bacterium]|nr:Gfo/Idh/MocA family oxidoreductase [Candidatus Omnitrophota bacterium]HPS37368.1 Gfo/Idh/MocA family oxidoreductase [Candidatus Omnitrophota bacterium]
MTKRIKVGVVGVGHLGKEHARIYRDLPEAELVGISDQDPAKAEKAKELGTVYYKDPRELIGKVEAVSIATPTSTHYAVAKEFLKAGIHTLIEKPITLRLEEADELLELSRKYPCALQVGHLERHNPGFRRVEEIAGNIRFLEIHRLGPFTGRINDCGVVLDLMIHDLDIILGLVKSEVAGFEALGVNVLTPFEDIANVRIKFKNGTIANLTASRLTFEKQRKIRIFQEDAYISLDYGAQTGKIIRKNGNEITQESVEIEKAEPLKEELKFFLNGILTGKSIGKPDTAARDALKLAIDIVRYIQENHPQPAAKA